MSAKKKTTAAKAKPVKKEAPAVKEKVHNDIPARPGTSEYARILKEREAKAAKSKKK